MSRSSHGLFGLGRGVGTHLKPFAGKAGSHSNSKPSRPRPLKQAISAAAVGLLFQVPVLLFHGIHVLLFDGFRPVERFQLGPYEAFFRGGYGLFRPEFEGQQQDDDKNDKKSHVFILAGLFGHQFPALPLAPGGRSAEPACRHGILP